MWAKLLVVPTVAVALSGGGLTGVAKADTPSTTDAIAAAAAGDVMPSVAGLDTSVVSADMQKLIGLSPTDGENFLESLSPQEQSILLWSIDHATGAVDPQPAEANSFSPADDPCAVMIVDNCFATVPSDIAYAGAAATAVGTPSPEVVPGDPSVLVQTGTDATPAARKVVCTSNHAGETFHSAGPSFLQYTVEKAGVQAQFCYNGLKITSINVTDSLNYCVFFVSCYVNPLVREPFYPGNEAIEADYAKVGFNYIARGVPIARSNFLEEEETDTGYYVSFMNTNP